MITRNQFPDLQKIKVWDPDTIETKNRNYTIYECSNEQIGKPKVDILKEELELLMYGLPQSVEIVGVTEEISSDEFLNLPADSVFISAVDGTRFRSGLFEHTKGKYSKLQEDNKHWIDLRSKGSEYLAIRNPHDKSEYEDLAPYYVDAGIEHTSCQLEADLLNNRVQVGNIKAAVQGLEFLLNIQVGLRNELKFEYRKEAR